jgi:hypothetical protein
MHVAVAVALGTAAWIKQGRFHDNLPSDQTLQLVSPLDVLPHWQEDDEALARIQAALIIPVLVKAIQELKFDNGALRKLEAVKSNQTK